MRTNTLDLKGASMYDLVKSGEAAQICGIDRRTFWARAKKGEIKPAGKTKDGESFFERKDVIALAKKIQAAKKNI